MEIPIPDDAFRGRGLAVRTAGFFKGPRLLIDGTEANGRRQRYTVRDNTGREVAIRLRTNHIDPIPKVEIDSKTIELARRLRELSSEVVDERERRRTLLGKLSSQTPRPRWQPGERYATYAGAYHCEDRSTG